MMELDGRTIRGLTILHYLSAKTVPATVDEVASALGMSVDGVARLLNRFRHAEWVTHHRGRGYLLVQGPGALSLNDVFRLLKGKADPAGGCRLRYHACPFRHSCPLSPLCKETYESNRRIFRTFTIADLGGLSAQLPDCLGRKAKKPRPARPGR